MMDGVNEGELTDVAIVTHLVGGLAAGAFGHGLCLSWASRSPNEEDAPPDSCRGP